MTMIPVSRNHVFPTLVVAFAAPALTLLGMYAGRKVIKKMEEREEEVEDEEEAEECAVAAIKETVPHFCDETLQEVKDAVDAEYDKRFNKPETPPVGEGQAPSE